MIDYENLLNFFRRCQLQTFCKQDVDLIFWRNFLFAFRIDQFMRISAWHALTFPVTFNSSSIKIPLIRFEIKTWKIPWNFENLSENKYPKSRVSHDQAYRHETTEFNLGHIVGLRIVSMKFINAAFYVKWFKTGLGGNFSTLLYDKAFLWTVCILKKFFVQRNGFRT